MPTRPKSVQQQSYIDPDNGSSGSAFGVDGTYHFNPVQTRNAPLAEAAFLDRASNVNAHATFADRGDVDDNTYGVGAEVLRSKL